MDITGAVESLQNNYTYLLQQLLVRPDLEDLNKVSITWNNQFQGLNTRCKDIETNVVTLINLYQRVWTFLTGISGTTGGGGDGGDGGGTDGPPDPANNLQESFETVSQNLRQLPYRIYYNTGDLITSIRYTLDTGSYVLKNFTYNNSGQLIQVSLTGVPVPLVTLNKYFMYSGENITGVYYQ